MRLAVLYASEGSVSISAASVAEESGGYENSSLAAEVAGVCSTGRAAAGADAVKAILGTYYTVVSHAEPGK